MNCLKISKGLHFTQALFLRDVSDVCIGINTYYDRLRYQRSVGILGRSSESCDRAVSSGKVNSSARRQHPQIGAFCSALQAQNSNLQLEA